MPRKNRMWVPYAVAALVACAAALGYGPRLLRPEGLPGPFTPESTDEPAGRSGDESLNEAENPQENADGIRVQRAIHYMGCGHTITRWEDPIADGDQLDLEAVRRANPGCEVTVFPSHIRIDQWICQYCPEHYVLFPDGEQRMAVYKNVDGGDMLTLWLTFQMELSLIPDNIRDGLAWGRAFDSMQDIEHFLEDVSS